MRKACHAMWVIPEDVEILLRGQKYSNQLGGLLRRASQHTRKRHRLPRPGLTDVQKSSVQ
jgi:hypothetical protein